MDRAHCYYCSSHFAIQLPVLFVYYKRRGSTLILECRETGMMYPANEEFIVSLLDSQNRVLFVFILSN